MSIVGAALLILVGVITLDSYDHPELGSPAGKALGGLCITAGALFAVNLLLVFKAIREGSPPGRSRHNSSNLLGNCALLLCSTQTWLNSFSVSASVISRPTAIV